MAGAVVAFAISVAWRARGIARRAGRGANAVRWLLLVASLASAGVVLALTLSGAGARTGAPGSGVVDALIGAALLIAATVLASRVAPLPARFGVAIWTVVVVAGAAVAASEPALCAALGERAPVAFAIGAACGG